MTKDEFEAEWDKVIRAPYLSMTHDSDRPNWYSYVPENIHKLSLEAQDYIWARQSIFGDFIIEGLTHAVLERALQLEETQENVLQ